MYKLNVKNLLDAKGKTQYWLSKQTGISANNVSKIYNGETINIRLDTINKLCEALECTPCELFIKDDTK
ncbi:helix-turn-helix domain-containing protein [Lachnospira eligens]|jgi:putative transcriptional regulator|uniref:XRE family transcriptional regulator n=2 Tax=root TaxID=1 RepID=A0A415ME55_9FIRM|nr:helix-turn-helix transcriptional regulator [Lachnospira eligens]RHA50480.1 XRE family transcriptional regulator [Lachnospira eligens]RHL71113.1 XRE family transcriptional regulator [Lachnospira eligens]DAE30337.1 MAG TPA: Cro/C1-type HTH DNA-binding domain protein [virus sp. ctiha2]